MLKAKWRKKVLILGALFSTGAAAISIGAVVSCGSTDAPYEQKKDQNDAEWNLGSDWVPFNTGYKGSVVATSINADTKVGSTTEWTTYKYDVDETQTVGYERKPFKVTYNWTKILPSIQNWTMPKVDHIQTDKQRFYSLFYDSNKPENDPGTGSVKVDSVHDGDTFSLVKTRDENLKDQIKLITNKLVEQNAMDQTTADSYKLPASTRLIGADTAESSYPSDNNVFIPTKGIEKLWADRATEFVKKEMGYGSTQANPIYITVTGEGDYHRLAADIKYLPTDLAGVTDANATDKQLEWNDLSADLVRYGLARVAYTDAKYMVASGTMPGVNPLNKIYIDYLIELQNEAMTARRGFWSTAKQQWWALTRIADIWNPGDAVFPKDFAITTENGLA